MKKELLGYLGTFVLIFIAKFAFASLAPTKVFSQEVTRQGAFTSRGMVLSYVDSVKNLPIDALNPSTNLVGEDWGVYTTLGNTAPSTWVRAYSFNAPLASGYGLNLMDNHFMVDTTIIGYWSRILALNANNVKNPDTANRWYPRFGNPLGYLTAVPAQTFASLTGKPTTLSGYGITDAYPLSGNPSGFLTSVPAQSFSSLTGKPTTVSGYGITDALTIPVPNAVTRPINSTTYTISTTKPAWVSYSVAIQCTATIGSASSGSVLLQYSTNAGSTWVDVSEIKNSNTVTLAVVLNSVTIQQSPLSGYIPANSLVRMAQTTAGTTTITYVKGQEAY